MNEEFDVFRVYLRAYKIITRLQKFDENERKESWISLNHGQFGCLYEIWANI